MLSMYIDVTFLIDRAIKNTTSMYIDNIYGNESLVSATRMWEHISDYELTFKDLGKSQILLKRLLAEIAWNEKKGGVKNRVQ